MFSFVPILPYLNGLNEMACTISSRTIRDLVFSLKSVHPGHLHSQLFASVNTRVHGKKLSLSYHAIVIL